MEEIYGFYLSEDPQTFRLNRMGEYRIVFLGAMHYSNRGDFYVELCRKDSREGIRTDKPWLLGGITIDWKPACIYRSFYIEKGGEFEMLFHNSEDLQLFRMRRFPILPWHIFFPWKPTNQKKVWVSIQYNQL